jgi:hypothetical protein
MVLAMAISLFAFMAPDKAEAFGWEHRHDGRTIHHRVYRPHYRHVYVRHDPYAYRPARVRYYPYYNSHYWRPLREYRATKIRYRYRLPDYYSSWGYPLPRKHYRKHYKKRWAKPARHRNVRQARPLK